MAAKCDIHPTDPLCAAKGVGPREDYQVTELDKWIMVLNCFIVTTMLIRLLLFLRIFEITMLMTVLVEKVTQDLIVLLLFWFIWVFFFALQSVVLGTNGYEVKKFHGTSATLAYVF